MTCDREPPLSYATFGDGFLSTYCTGCHSSLLVGDYQRNDATTGVDFDSWEGVVNSIPVIAIRTLATGDDPSMPPAGGPSSIERARFDEWLQCEVEPAQQEAAEGSET